MDLFHIYNMIIVIINYTTTEKVLFKYEVKTLAYKKNPGYAIGYTLGETQLVKNLNFL